MDQEAQPDRSQILAALDAVKDPKTGQGLAAAGLVRGLSIRTGRAGFMLEVPAADIAAYAAVREAAERALAAVPGVTTAQVVLTAEAAPDLKVTPRRAPAQGHAPAAAPRRARVQEDPQARLGAMPEAERP